MRLSRHVVGALVTAALLLASCGSLTGDALDLALDLVRTALTPPAAASDAPGEVPRGGPPDRCAASLCDTPLDRRVELADPTDSAKSH
jgi:hypothetical protein